MIDAGGRFVLPGLTDSHVHFIGGAEGRQRVMLDDAETIAEIQRRVKAYADAHPDAPWILGGGWYYAVFGAAALPDRRLLDEAVPDRPVFLWAYDFHSSWANSKALELAGITAATADPANGAIVRDPRTRQATGALKETAGGLIEKVIPAATRESKLEALRQGIRYANSLGITRVHSAGWDAEQLELYDALRANGELTLRFLVAPNILPPAATPEVIARVEGLREKFADQWLNVGAVKFMLDGVIEAHTASVLAPYADDPSQGTLNWDEAAFRAAVAEFDRRGFQIFTHAIGDRAIRVALDAYEGTRGGPPQRAASASASSTSRAPPPNGTSRASARWASSPACSRCTPRRATTNLNVWSKALGPERASRAWPWRTALAPAARGWPSAATGRW